MGIACPRTVSSLSTADGGGGLGPIEVGAPTWGEAPAVGSMRGVGGATGIALFA
jgi:hypothetical protein